jgi:hypothetical protein
MKESKSLYVELMHISKTRYGKKTIRLPEELNSTMKQSCTFGSGLISTG